MTSDRSRPTDRSGPASDARGGEAPLPVGRPVLDTSIAHQARMYDYFLGGKDNFEADRAAAEAAIAAYPGIVALARANRAFLGRAVRFLAGEAGIRQFLDVGTGIPTASNTHEVAQDTARDCRVVYVDYDPVVLSYARALLTSSPEGAADYIDADLRDTEAVLRRAARTLDFSRPVAVMLLAVLHAIEDGDGPHQIVARYMDAVPSGSYLVISHLASDIERDRMEESRDRVNSISRQQYTHRSREEVARFFDGLDLVEPGVVQPQQWRPAISDPRVMPGWCAVGRKP